MKQFGHHHPMMYKTEDPGIPFIKNINDIYPVGSLCDLSIEDVVDNAQNIYMMTLTPKVKV